MTDPPPLTELAAGLFGELLSIEEEGHERLLGAATLQNLDALRAGYLGEGGILDRVRRRMGRLHEAERRTVEAMWSSTRESLEADAAAREADCVDGFGYPPHGRRWSRS